MRKKKQFDATEYLEPIAFVLIGIAVVVLAISFIWYDIGFQPEDEFCIAYQCNCDKTSYHNTDDYTKCIGCRDIHCESWRDKTPEEKELEKCQKIINQEEIKKQKETVDKSDVEMHSIMPCPNNTSLKPTQCECRKIHEDDTYCLVNSNICYECR